VLARPISQCRPDAVPMARSASRPTSSARGNSFPRRLETRSRSAFVRSALPRRRRTIDECSTRTRLGLRYRSV